MIYRILFLLLALMSACAPSRLMSPTDFNSISTGVDVAKLEEIYGPPFDITDLPNGSQQYRYLQRIYINADSSEQVEYLFTVRNGRIIDKQTRQQHSSFSRFVQ